MNISLVIILRLIHILVGVFWVGGTVLVAFFLLPTVQATAAVGGQFLATLMQRTKLTFVLAGAGLLVVLSGLWMYSGLYGDIPWDTFGPHIVFGIGGIIALLALVIGAAIGPATARKMAALGARLAAQGTPPTPDQMNERARLMNRLANLARFNAAALLLAAAFMAVARYV